MDIPEIIEKIDGLPKGALLRRIDQTEKSSKQVFDENFHVKLGPHPAWPRG